MSSLLQTSIPSTPPLTSGLPQQSPFIPQANPSCSWPAHAEHNSRRSQGLLQQHRRRACPSLKCSAEGLMQEVETPGRVDDGKDFALAMARIASDVKGQDLCLLHVAPLCTWTSWMLFVSVTSRPQQQAVLARVTREAKERWDRTPRSATPGQGLWEVQDYGDVVIHVFEPAQREYYDLEGFYGAAEEIDIPEPQRAAPR